MIKKLLLLFLIAALLLATPFIGVIIEGDSIYSFLEFPPRTKYVSHERFSILFFVLLAIFTITVLALFILKIIRSQKHLKSKQNINSKFPAWGWSGIVLLIAAWILAWARFQWFEEFQMYTFTPIWLAYVIIINGFTYMRVGKSLITHSPKYLILLFLFSAIFWWYYEYLNQFVNNWYYTEPNYLNNIEYFLQATLPFSSVLPAVISTWLFLKTFPRLSAGLEDFLIIRITQKESFWWIILLVNMVGLGLAYIRPQYLFPFIWLAPLLIIASVISIAGGKTILHNIETGNWKDIFLLAMAALICGLFWEMWNYYSFAKWEYSIPFVHRYLIFEMPLIGYMGYLPFGIQCGLIGLIINGLTKTDLDYSINNSGK